MDIVVQPIANVHNTRTTPADDEWGSVTSEITLSEDIPGSALDGIEAFSHLEVIFHFDKANSPVVYSRRPRGNPA